MVGKPPVKDKMIRAAVNRWQDSEWPICLSGHIKLLKSVLKQHLCYKSINCPWQYGEITRQGINWTVNSRFWPLFPNQTIFLDVFF